MEILAERISIIAFVLVEEGLFFFVRSNSSSVISSDFKPLLLMQ